MLIQKTDIAKAALQNRQIALTPKQRQLLILTDGLRSSETLSEMVGRDVSAELEVLLTMKMVEPVGQKEQPIKPAPHNVSGKKQSRRSLAATKMYLIDVLQMMRDLDASSLAVSLHASESEQDFVDSGVDSLHFITVKNGNSFARRVLARVLEVIPETHMGGLQQLVHELDLTNTFQQDAQVV